MTRQRPKSANGATRRNGARHQVAHTLSAAAMSTLRDSGHGGSEGAQPMTWSRRFSQLACRTAQMAGKPMAFLTATALVVVWAVTGPLFGFSDTWQLVINT